MSTCPTCKKPNCGNWAACARRSTQREFEAYSAELVWWGIGVAEKLYQELVKSKAPAFLSLAAVDPSEARRLLFIEALQELGRRDV